MNQNTRTGNVIRNILGGVGGQIFTSLLQFGCRTIFISLLGATYLGVNGLFSNVLSMLSLAELGIGPAIVFSMYKPIADNDELHVAKLMNFYKKSYRIVAAIVLLIGLMLVPFLDFFINDTSNINNLKVIFLLILMNTVVSYLYAYKGSMLNADQKAYIGVIIKNVFAVVQNIAQILVLLATGNYILYLVVQIMTTFIANFVQAKYVDKKYPFLVKFKNETVDKAEQRSIMQRVKGMMMHKLGSFVLNGTDNIVISKFIGVVAVGIYSNYSMIINLIKTFLTQITGSVTASVGNLIAKETKEKVHEVFNAMLLMYFWIYSFCFISFWVVFQPFIELWIGNEYLLDKGTLLLVLVNFYFTGYQNCVNNYINATGLFWETRYKPIVECLINLFVSIVLAYKIGIIGVFIGTLMSFLCTFWVNPILLYKKYFNKSMSLYFIKFIGYFAWMIVIAFGLEFFATEFLKTSVLLWDVIIRIVMCAVIPNLIFVMFFHKTAGFLYLKRLVLSIVKKVRRNRT